VTNRKSKKIEFEVEDLGDIELSPELTAKIEKMVAGADIELEATRVNFRWQREPLSLVKLVAASMGVPYQTYIKQVLYKQALEDFTKIQSTRKTVQR